ncbi:50S ribosomal protein L31e [Candidatus Bathycorpusculum sp.]|jgi:large subunit ribosomal protein L31e|uniref:50S ribosomal protein L31e n=1 Tax=Candidatus Bathycorpusculum sp. TaxID=2994959 RepID=UPI00282E894B|nr:60S ribosomal protein L31 [Candidatus Termitimicrobium sp.]MCL2685061.1 60S ribosomal protein L31 [Candidatus Termitimicrobium sp.]
MTKETEQEQVLQEELEELAELPEGTIEETAEPEQAVAKEEAASQKTQAKEEAKAQRKKKDDDIVEERFYTIPLQRALVRPPKKRAPRAMQIIKLFAARHMKLQTKVTEEDEGEELPQVIIAPEVNEKVWGRGIEKPPRRIKTRVTKDKDGYVTVYLAENQ